MTPCILIYANCQGEELMVTGRFMPILAGRVTFKWIPLHLVASGDWSMRYGPEFMADVTVLWEQVETGPPSAHRQALHRQLPAACQIVRFPPLNALCLWPFAGNDPRLAADPARYPWPDSVAASLAAGDQPDEVLFQRYMTITTERMPDLERRLRMDVARWRAVDEESDVRIAGWAERQFREVKLFHAAGHLTAAPIAFLLWQLLERTTILPNQILPAAHAEIDTLLRHHQGQDFESVPIHPLVAERLGLRFYDPNTLYRWHSHEWTLREYILHYIHWAPYIG
ncbi:MAG TPA: WcbI family polysaccharide biosynthesis putative acetyltransferase [Acetobacteraceae bacterium]|nr:WcbI family polysaccharide biosynthesis putative acetyltransferase [Acetobacteraceae bacterium]